VAIKTVGTGTSTTVRTITNKNVVTTDLLEATVGAGTKTTVDAGANTTVRTITNKNVVTKCVMNKKTIMTSMTTTCSIVLTTFEYIV
jgi:hypothetical protein